MRDPKRINPIIDAVRNIWYQNPNMRFGQILVAVTGKEDPFYVEDDILLEKLTTGIESQEMPTADPARIERFLTVLRNVWEKVPDWRLCQ